MQSGLVVAHGSKRSDVFLNNISDRGQRINWTYNTTSSLTTNPVIIIGVLCTQCSMNHSSSRLLYCRLLHRPSLCQTLSDKFMGLLRTEKEERQTTWGGRERREEGWRLMQEEVKRWWWWWEELNHRYESGRRKRKHSSPGALKKKGKLSREWIIHRREAPRFLRLWRKHKHQRTVCFTLGSHHLLRVYSNPPRFAGGDRLCSGEVRN